MPWGIIRIATELAGIVVLSGLVLLTYRRHRRGDARAWRLIPGLMLGNLGTAVLLLYNLTLASAGASRIVRWAGLACVGAGLLMVLTEWRKSRDGGEMRNGP